MELQSGLLKVLLKLLIVFWRNLTIFWIISLLRLQILLALQVNVTNPKCYWFLLNGAKQTNKSKTKQNKTKEELEYWFKFLLSLTLNLALRLELNFSVNSCVHVLVKTSFTLEKYSRKLFIQKYKYMATGSAVPGFRILYQTLSRDSACIAARQTFTIYIYIAVSFSYTYAV